MKVERTSLDGVLLIEPASFADARGVFVETFQSRRYAAAGIDDVFVQDNASFSEFGVLRGLHLQHPHGQAKLVYVLQGAVFDVAVDLRVGSPGFGQWLGLELSAENKRQLFIPSGFAHGFCVTSDTALLAYKCTDFYSPASELSIAWNDPFFGIAWPVPQPSLSAKDKAAPCLKEIDAARLPQYERAIV